jgi:hypothetical protein
MPDLTRKRMDAAIRRELDQAGFNPCGGPVEDWQRAIYLAGKIDGMRAAAKTNVPLPPPMRGDEFREGMMAGRDRTLDAIRAVIRRLKREAKNAAD